MTKFLMIVSSLILTSSNTAYYDSSCSTEYQKMVQKQEAIGPFPTPDQGPLAVIAWHHRVQEAEQAAAEYTACLEKQTKDAPDDGKPNVEW